MTTFADLITADRKPALFLGNGINRYANLSDSSWDDLLSEIAEKFNVDLTKDQIAEMSNTEYFDILNLAKPKDDRENLKAEFCKLMESWVPSTPHERVMGWAKRHQSPVLTVNFDANLSTAAQAEFFKGDGGFTDFYPWNCYFSDKEITSPSQSFAIWHPHGMQRYKRSVRLGLTDYMGSVSRVRPWLHRGEASLSASHYDKRDEWIGSNTWVDILFKREIVIFGFGFGKDEAFMRWLFVERARFARKYDLPEPTAWYVDAPGKEAQRKPFFEAIGLNYITADFDEVYAGKAWER